MTEKRDYYEVLSVSREAGEEEIRKAYRKAALQFHPDRNPDNPEAEARFKEATEAYGVLSDQEKRSIYDRFGHAGLEGRGMDFGAGGLGDIFGQFQDMFSDFFGFSGGFGGAQRRQQARGADLRVGAVLTLQESMTGCKKEVAVRGVAPCDDCSGSGAKPGTRPSTCPQCGGNGQVTTQRGFIMFSTSCPRCRGSGQVVVDPCTTCNGAGSVEKRRKVVVTFPPGIDTGQRLRVSGQGMPGPGGKPPGDLYVDVELRPDEHFKREADDLITRARVSFADATLGTEVEVVLPDESIVKAAIAEGTQPGSVLSIRGKGVPHVDGQGRGDLHLLVEVDVPKKLSKRAKKLLKELEEELAQSVAEHRRAAGG